MPGATPSGATAASSRSVISTAARLLNVIARIASGGVPVAISQAARATSVVVLPLPAGAMHNDGPGGAVAAARWSGASRARRSATAGWRSIAHCRGRHPVAALIRRPVAPNAAPYLNRNVDGASGHRRAVTPAAEPPVGRRRRVDGTLSCAVQGVVSGSGWSGCPMTLRGPTDLVTQAMRTRRTPVAKFVQPPPPARRCWPWWRLLFSAVASPVPAAPKPKKPSPVGSAERTVMFASDGMRPDLMEKYAKAGFMPTYRKLMKQGVTGANGMIQAFPPNTGVGWYTMATGAYPADHGSTNNTYFRAGDTFSNRTSFSAPGTLQADTIADAAERAGKKVAQIDWVGGAAANIQGPTVDFTNFFTNRGVLVGAADSVEAAGSAFFGVNYEDATLAAAVGLERRARRAIPRPRRRRRRGWSRRRSSAATSPRLRRLHEPQPDLQRLHLRQRHRWRRRATTTSSSALSERPARAPRSTSRSAISRRIRLTGAERPRGHARRPDGRPLREAHLAHARRQPVQALPHLAHARHRPLRHGLQHPARRRRPARTGSRSTSPTTCRLGRPATSRRWKRPSSTRTPMSSRAATSSGPTAWRSSTSSSERFSPTPTWRWSATRSPTRSRTSSWASSRPTDADGDPNPCYDVNPKFDDVQCTGRGTAGRVAIREGYIRSAYQDADEKLGVARSLMGGNPTTSPDPTTVRARSGTRSTRTMS